jgi:hypothetical protein
MLISLRDEAIRNALITQHTLYPYHFEQGGAELTDLGRQDLAVLVEHAQRQSGRLNVKQGGISEELYAARLDAVKRALTAGGLDSGRITLVDALPGGDGMPSTTVNQLIQGRNSPSEPLYYSDTGAASSGTTISGGSSGSSGGGNSR